jgi:hypothetical protein
MASAQNQSWTATAIDGNSYSIQDILDQGKTVLVDISAHWCGPCWAWHNSGIMEKIYREFGPDGTNDLMIFYVDGSYNSGGHLESTLALLQGTGSGDGMQGDWTAGTPYPIIGPNGYGMQLATAYNISAFPTLFMHCPGSNTGVEIQRTATWEQFLSSWRTGCPAAFANGAIDAHLLEVENTELCPGEHPVADVFNQGTSALTSATLTLRENGNVVETKNWTGNIAAFQHSVVSFDNTTVAGTATYEAEVSAPNGGVDANPLGNIQAESFSMAPEAPSTLVSLELKTDNYGSETGWKLKDGNGAVVQQVAAGTYADGSSSVHNYSWSLNPSECYTFEITDAYGDGICCSYGTGYYKLKNTWGTAVVFQQGAQFGGVEDKGFDTPATVGVQENSLNNGLSIYPNPTSGIVNLEFAENTTATVDVFNVLGERVMTSTFNTNGVRTIDLGALNNGVYYMNVTAGSLTATRKITLSK